VYRIHLQLHSVVLYSIDLPVRSRYISRTHCRISRTADRVRIEGMNSTNGLMLRGKRIRFGSLSHGDVIAIGIHRLPIEMVAPGA
jgi:pSer/pThr/pTyr-binding forkhead associated (FHA) protein